MIAIKAENFKAVAVTKEISLDKIAHHFGIARKYKWEECLKLSGSSLKGILSQPDSKAIYIFPFGSVVFLNSEPHEINDAIRYLSETEKSLPASVSLDYTDDYTIQVTEQEQPAINNDYMVTSEERDFHGEIVATVLAKSVALERIESDIDILLDEIEGTVALLRKAQLFVSDDQLAKTSARILGFRLSTISYIMLLDKPDITWVNEEAAALFDELSRIFELNDRYENIKHKTEILMDITTAFAGLAHAKRGTRLEWAIIVLIGIEILLSLVGMITR